MAQPTVVCPMYQCCICIQPFTQNKLRAHLMSDWHRLTDQYLSAVCCLCCKQCNTLLTRPLAPAASPAADQLITALDHCKFCHPDLAPSFQIVELSSNPKAIVGLVDDKEQLLFSQRLYELISSCSASSESKLEALRALLLPEPHVWHAL
ncbi:protein ORF6 [Lake sturgeon herpesvirus]|nr:protein ORF6 [Lake sturgeon herpesvirus]